MNYNCEKCEMLRYRNYQPTYDQNIKICSKYDMKIENIVFCSIGEKINFNKKIKKVKIK